MHLRLFMGLGLCGGGLWGQFSVGDLPAILGSGPETAVLVIDFNNGVDPDSFAWSYRFGGENVSGADLLLAIAASDPALTVSHGGTGEDGFFLTAVRYEYKGTLYEQEGVYPTASWGYYLAGGTAGGANVAVAGGNEFPEIWEASMVGASDTAFGSLGRILSDGAWDYWSVGPYDTETFDHLGTPEGFPVPAPIPEPTILTTILGILIAATFQSGKRGLRIRQRPAC